MASKEGQQPKVDLKLGDTVFVHTEGVEDEPQAMEVATVGDKRVIAKIGGVQITESSFTLTLKPVTPKVEPQSGIKG